MTELKKNAIIKRYCKEAREHIDYITYIVNHAIIEEKQYFMAFNMKETESAEQLRELLNHI